MAQEKADGDKPIGTLKRLFVTKELDESIVCMAVSPDGQLVAAGSLDDGITVYDATNGAVRILLDGHLGGTNSLVFMPCRERLASAGEDGTLKIWQISSGDEEHSFICDGVDVDKNPSGWSVSNVAVDVAGTKVACSAGKTVHLYTLEGPNPEENACVFPPVEGGVVTGVRFTRKDNIIYSFYGGINVAPAEPDTQATTMPLKTCVECLDASPDNDWFVGGCHDQTLHIWHLVYSEELDGFDCLEMACGGYTQKVTVCNWQPGAKAKLLASAGGRALTVWNFETTPAGTMPLLAIGHTAVITCQAWKPDGSNWIVSASKGGSVAIHDLEASSQRSGGPRMCHPVAFSPGPGDPVVACAWTQDDTIIVAYQRGIILGYKFEAGQMVPDVD